MDKGRVLCPINTCSAILCEWSNVSYFPATADAAEHGDIREGAFTHTRIAKGGL